MPWFRKREKAELDAAVAAAARPTTELVVEGVRDPSELPITSTHFGGEPYAEAGETWPVWGDDGRPFDHVMQIDLRECPTRPDLPIDLVTVFLCWRAIVEVDVEGACLVRAYRDPSPDKAVRLERPPPVEEDDYRVVACAVGTEDALTYPWSMEESPGVLAAASRFRDPHAAYSASVRRVGGYDRYFSRVGGFPTWVHDNTLEDGDLVFLAQIGYEPQANNCIGDAAPIFIAVSKSDPTVIETDAFQSF